MSSSSLVSPLASCLDGLNPEQRAAVEKLDGPLLVLAGAGTGKTRVLTTRFAHLVLTRRAWPSQILAVTFTNKAAREMRERVSALLGEPVDGGAVGTFHAICARMLRRDAARAGLAPGFTILDTDDQLRVLKQVMEPMGLDPKRFPPQAMMQAIQRWKDRGVTAERVPMDEASAYANGHGATAYRDYQARLRALNAVDFGDLMLTVTELLRGNPDLLAQYHQRYKYIMVDEYQDTNLVQYLWLRLLAQSHHNICCVGDDDQSIYSWRGAEVENILRFEKDFPAAEVVRLERNYRSTAAILSAASGLIAHNDGRLGKVLRPAGQHPDANPVEVMGLRDSDEEAMLVASRIAGLRASAQEPRIGEVAILVRTGYQTRVFEEKLFAAGIPYRVVGGLRFYERAEIRDAIAYARLIVQPADDLAFERIVNVPRRGLGSQSLQEIRGFARARSISMTEAAAAIVAAKGTKARGAKSLRQFLVDLARWRDQLEIGNHVQLLASVLSESGYNTMLENDTSVEAAGRLENLRELQRALAEFETLEAFLDHIALVNEREDASADAFVTISTLHAAKGLEFDAVFLPGWEEGLFPSRRAMDETGLKGLEEERRLAYVGITRAKKRLMISFAASRRMYNNWQDSIPSRFIDELPAGSVKVNTTITDRPGRNNYANADSSFTRGGYAAMRTRTAEPWEARPRPPAKHGYRIGARVFHQKFGYGVVRAVDNNTLEVAFEQTGLKHIMSDFLEPAA